MNLFLLLLAFYYILLQKISLLEALSGSVVLDSITFDKIITKFGTVLVKFDIQYPYGEKHEEFEKAAKRLTNNDILMAEVGVQQFGDKQNMDLIEKYGITIDDLPVCKLFINGDLHNIIHFDDQFEADSIIRFIRRHTATRITLNVGLEEFDELAQRFAENIGEEERIDMFTEAKQKLIDLENQDHKTLANIYIKIMDKVMKTGIQFIENETKRLTIILKTKLTENKRNEIQTKIDILLSFTVNQSLRKDEF